tara:strand:- start:388 stop:1338 length:951 start_codon:yes stop_codon:yes gene_type:complete
MVHKLSPFMLGATLYMPANRSDLSSVILDKKISGLRSLVICLEDALNECDIPDAFRNLTNLAAEISDRDHSEKPLLFIRPRSIAMAKKLVDQIDLSCFTGFVLPKFVLGDLDAWWNILENTHLYMMPTLETKEVFNANEMLALAKVLEMHQCKDRLLALRIGGNDLMSALSLRRSRSFTIYESPLGFVIKMLVSIFASHGFYLTAPVCELIDDQSLIEKELELDVAHGLVGKTAIHPSQIEIIESAFMVNSEDVSDALKIINSSQAVFANQGAMCEPATHRRWAHSILERSFYFGVYSSLSNIASHDDIKSHKARS